MISNRETAKRLYRLAWDKDGDEESIDVVLKWINNIDGNFREILRQIAEKCVGWRYVEKDGNPDKEGYYCVVLLYPECEWTDERHFEVREIEGGKTFYSIEHRYFADAKKFDGGWIMYDQPDEGMVWTEESGSNYHEKVYAWLPLFEDYSGLELPEGVVSE